MKRSETNPKAFQAPEKVVEVKPSLANYGSRFARDEEGRTTTGEERRDFPSKDRKLPSNR